MPSKPSNISIAAELALFVNSMAMGATPRF
jgi:hypothetical protein